MPDMTVYGKQQLLAIGTGLLLPPVLYLALFSNSANTAGTPTELVVANYVRQPVAMFAVSADVVANSHDVLFTNLGAGSFLGAQLRDTLSGGTAWAWVDQGASVTIPAGTTLTFVAGTITVTRT